MTANTFYNIIQYIAKMLTFIYNKVAVLKSRSLRNTASGLMNSTIAPIMNRYQY